MNTKIVRLMSLISCFTATNVLCSGDFLRGSVTDASLAVIPDAGVELMLDERVALETRSEINDEFSLPFAYGGRDWHRVCHPSLRERICAGVQLRYSF